MNFLTTLLNSIAETFRRAPWFWIMTIIIAIAAPSLFGYLLYAILALVLLFLLSMAIFAWRLRRVERNLHEQFRKAGEQAGHQQYNYRSSRRKAANEGDVSIHATPAMPEKRINDDVGEYVDFKEEKTNDK